MASAIIEKKIKTEPKYNSLCPNNKLDEIEATTPMHRIKSRKYLFIDAKRCWFLLKRYPNTKKGNPTKAKFLTKTYGIFKLNIEKTSPSKRLINKEIRPRINSNLSLAENLITNSHIR